MVLMRKLFKYVSLPYYSSNKLRLGLTIVGVGLGVAVFTSIRIANVSTMESFYNTIEAISGRAQLQIAAGESGFDERLLWRLRGIKRVEALAPVVQSTSRVEGARGELIIISGVDLVADKAMRDYYLKFGKDKADPLKLLTDSNSILIGEAFAARNGIKEGSQINLFTPSGKTSFTVRGLLALKGPAEALGGNFALMDIAAAQTAFSKIGRLSRIDVTLEKGADIDQVAGALQERIGTAADVQRPERRKETVDKMLRSFQVNLTALSLIALFVGTFMIYNTVSFSLLMRRKEIGILRSIGTKRAAIGALFLLEAFAIGLLGSAFGLVLGIAFSKFALKMMSETVSALFILVSAQKITITNGTIILALSVGLFSSLGSALAPIIEAARVKPSEALQAAGHEIRQGRAYGKYTLLGAALLLSSFFLSRPSPVFDTPIFGYITCFVLVLGASFVVPGALVFLCDRVLPLLRGALRGEVILAKANLRSNISRASAATAALMASFAMVVSVGIMIASFKKTINTWVDQAVRADLVINQASPVAGVAALKMGENLGKDLLKLKGVKEIDGFLGLNVNFKGEQVFLAAADFDVYRKYGHFAFKEGEQEKAIDGLISGGGGLVSENFAERFKVRHGDTIELASPSGPLRLEVAGVILDYTSERGTVTIDRSLYKRYWRDDLVDTFGVFLEPGYKADEVAMRIKESLGDKYDLFVMTNKKFKAEIMALLDQSFSIAYALQLIALLVAVLGITNSLLASIIERERELGIMRAIGSMQRQIKKLIVIEAVFMGIIGQIIGIATGTAVSLVLIYVINKQSFGWTLQVAIPYALVLSSMAGILAASALAAYFPARRAAQMDLGAALKYE